MELFENWNETKSALLEGLDSSNAGIVDTLLENQKNQMLSEDAAGGSVQAHDIAGFRKIMIPMIRRIIPGTIATELVGVQPMQGPVGLVYSMRYKYADGSKAGDELFGNSPVVDQFYSGQLTNGVAGEVAVDPGMNGIGPSGVTEAGNTAGALDTEGGEAWGSSLAASAGTGTNADRFLGGSGSYAEGQGGRRLTMEVVSQAVEAGSRKLQAGWTIEAMQDLNAQHGMDVESEMTSAISAEIVQEIDAEILTDLKGLAGTTATYDGATAGIYTPAFAGDRHANLQVIINWVANEIGRKTRRGSANWIVVPPVLVSVLQSAGKSVFAPSTEGSFKGPNNSMLVGTLNGTIKVYSYLWDQAQPGAATTEILVGYKGGNGQTDTGYFYCPYIPLMSSGVVVNPVTFQPAVSLMTRYGKTTFTNSATSLGNSADYYGKVTVNNIAIV